MKVYQRATARMLGVSDTTIKRDTATNVAPDEIIDTDYQEKEHPEDIGVPIGTVISIRIENTETTYVAPPEKDPFAGDPANSYL